MDALEERAESEAKKRKRKKHEAKMKQRRRLAGSGVSNYAPEADQEEDLFALANIKSSRDLDRVFFFFFCKSAYR